MSNLSIRPRLVLNLLFSTFVLLTANVVMAQPGIDEGIPFDLGAHGGASSGEPVTAEDTLKMDSSGTTEVLSVKLSIAPGTHIYSLDQKKDEKGQGPFPTKISL